MSISTNIQAKGPIALEMRRADASDQILGLIVESSCCVTKKAIDRAIQGYYGRNAVINFWAHTAYQSSTKALAIIVDWSDKKRGLLAFEAAYIAYISICFVVRFAAADDCIANSIDVISKQTNAAFEVAS